MTAEQLIHHLQLVPHPEGGFYKEIYRSSGTIAADCLAPVFDGDRHFSTSIYYLLQSGDFSAFHRIKSDEIWHFYAGGELWLHVITETGGYQCLTLGNTLKGEAQFQVVMPAGAWFAAEPATGTPFTLAGCTVSPGFDFRDFEMAKKDELAKRYPEHRAIIERLCR
ncbi:cupin domain-containing protein [Flavisolibacter sp. BT320]|nr:cupin domain-containing protein [Flavisolibacter longurius]